jgi:flagellar biosynthesis/type III secretory pathway chaperone
MNNDTSPGGVIEAAEALATILEEENRGLSTQDFAVSAALAEAKRAAIGRLEAALDQGVAGTPRDRRRIEAVQRRLDAASDANGKLLRQAIETQQRVVQTVMQALDTSRAAGEPLQPYGQDGAARPATPVAFVLRA